ncbi:nuclear transport factor 2 family protein [Aquiluna borgnonia]|uniref:Nuclear transport factor 2 family protein n=1 Tax=Aquiluna borgnonia TaxID=2499157 RepID=A0A7D4PY31_9MICO|nr:nuclear transport factor 2 family protein [Aquiluna borgnonia]QKJ25804.1 nuclear transport factor 2 family protein [Aquiluna borgnonia]
METSSIDIGIIKLLDDYFEVIHAQNMELFDQVFHPQCCLYSSKDSEPVLRPYELYRSQVAGRQSPAELGNPRKDEILMVDQLSDTMALAKVQLQMFGGVMQDYLNLIKLDGKWWVIAKLYEQVGTY